MNLEVESGRDSTSHKLQIIGTLSHVKGIWSLSLLAKPTPCLGFIALHEVTLTLVTISSLPIMCLSLPINVPASASIPSRMRCLPRVSSQSSSCPVCPAQAVPYPGSQTSFAALKRSNHSLAHPRALPDSAIISCAPAFSLQLT